ncbi:MAG: FG-GAP-like repeat-containing protein [Isosphaeraceae bacterium]
MRRQFGARVGFLLISALGLLAAAACRTREPEPNASTPGPSAGPKNPAEVPAELLKNEIPPGALAAVMTAHFKGLGYMEQYKYADAADCFREVHRLAPGWVPGSINLAIALLNFVGLKVEEAKKAGGDAATSNFDEAMALLDRVLERDPENPYAHYCEGIILKQQGSLFEAHRHFKRVTEIDPNDAGGWYWAASTLTDPKDPNRPVSREQAMEQIALLDKALERDPYLTPAIYRLAFAYRLAGQPQKQRDLLERWKKINPDRSEPVPGPGTLMGDDYGDSGKYASVVNPFRGAEPGALARAVPLNFDPARPIQITLPEGDRWVKPSDFTGPLSVIGRARSRSGAAVAAFDADGDGLLDLYLVSAVSGPKGIRDVLLLNKGDGRFEDASAAFGIPRDHASIGAAAADFDADRHVDLYLTGSGDNRLLHNEDGKRFVDISSKLPAAGPKALSLTARWLDLDQDGDLDLYVLNYCSAADAEKAFHEPGEPVAGSVNSVYRNDGRPQPIPGRPEPNWAPLAVANSDIKARGGLSIALTPWTGSPALSGTKSRHTGIALLDVDNDRDLDVVLAAEGQSAYAILNDRLGQFHQAPLGGVGSGAVSGLLVTDLDSDGRADLVAASAAESVCAWRNTTEQTTTAGTKLSFESWPLNASRWRTVQAVDLDLDGAPDLLGAPTGSDKPGEVVVPAWARNEGKRHTVATLPVRLESIGVLAVAAIDLVGDPLPDILVLRPGESPVLARNQGNGQHWLALLLGGHWHVKPELMRSNSHAIGTRLTIEGQGIHVAYDHTTPNSALGQSVGPVVLGLGQKETAELVHVRWPDGVLQCELNVVANQKLILAENNRKTGSCPVLFTWNGRRFVCIGDFLGGGGLGYLVAPGVYSQPDRDECVAISSEQLQPEGGVLRLAVTEPMDEVAYLDQLRLEVVDRPADVTAAPDERFAPAGPRPTGTLMAWRTVIEPAHATDLEGRDMSETLGRWDRRTVDTFRKLAGFIGYAEEHGIVLDFGGRLSRFGATDRLVLGLAGWVEYPYSQTNYRAATAGITLKPPTIERRRDDGSWQIIEPHAGYPAGLPRLTTLDLTGKLTGPRCVLRIKTNMECYYDQAFVALRDREAEASLRVTTLPPARAVLAYRGYTREISPDGGQPLIYDYDYIDPAPLARLAGKLTRYGDVARLLEDDDDLVCVVGPGDEVRLEFEGSGLPALPVGWTRSYVLKACGYCKDADPFTATSDSVEPLPWRDMPAFPFGPDVKRRPDSAFQSYLREFETRPAGGGD